MDVFESDVGCASGGTVDVFESDVGCTSSVTVDVFESDSCTSAVESRSNPWREASWPPLLESSSCASVS